MGFFQWILRRGAARAGLTMALGWTALIASADAAQRRGGAPEQLDARGVPVGVYVRRGFELSAAVPSLPAARFMKIAPDGTLYVSQMRRGTIAACRDRDGDGVYETVTTFVSGHPTVHGLFWHDGWLWFAEEGAIFRGRDTNGDGVCDEEETIIPRGQLPTRGHNWRPILIHNGRLYTGIGDSGNITDERETPRQKIWSYALDGTDPQLFCSGLRNTEKLVVRPGTDEIWGVDHGSDWFGRVMEQRENVGQPITDLNPPEEMNKLEQGKFYGHPFITGNRVPRYEFIDRPDIAKLAAETTPPEFLFPAHWAPNAMEFYDADQFPGHRGDAFVAFHGSWNRSVPDGYCVARVLFDDGHPYGMLVYVKFLDANNRPLGRPVDCAVAPDGSLLISDDLRGRIYRLRYVGDKATPEATPTPTAQ